MTRRIPVFATIVVLAAAATMIALGFWQLRRLHEKEALLAHYAQAATMSADARWPATSEDYPSALYRHAQLNCADVVRIDSIAGRSLKGRAGWAQVAECRLADDQAAAVALGWSEQPQPPIWSGGKVSGFIGPAGKGIKLVASPAQAGLEPLALPDPEDIPNNHLAYAVQWFLFAATALVIYGLALRKRGRQD